MEQSETIALLKAKITKILFLLLLVRLGLYIPVPNIDLDLFSQNQNTNPIFGFAKTLTGSSFLGIGALGILPYINASIIIQLLVPVLPQLEQLQKEEGEFGRQQITRYTRYLALIWAIILSTAIAFFLVKPIIFDWSISLALEIILALVTGSILSMWFSELITEEGLGNGSSMLIFINIVGSIPNSFSELNNALFSQASYLDNLRISGQGLIFYLFVVSVIILFQDSYKKINIVAAKQLNLSSSDQSQNFSQLKNSYIPLKVNQGGIMPLVFSSTIAVFLAYPVQQLLNLGFVNNSFLSVYSITINILLVVLFSCFYAGLVLKPDDISQNLAKMAYSIPGVRQGKDTTKYLQKTVERLAFLGGLFLAFLAFFPLVVGNVLHVNIFKNVTSLLILIGVITDVTSQIRGYLVARKYEGFK
uniref:Protein translocase subunit SecY n=1 Tax=Phaeocystis globosa TaxID=33658 RepID=A0A891ZP94_9EUKA|nr:preprotein translocase subunit SecY [Phaeocystis globosa]QRN72758.1 preprotein translocase subunit SecY [Phaeocystis globosa]QRN72866.1 preprotein translocase subunit SecY [Phaeocystis globosa]QRN72974.1 preprotein translocase subunit SecY [Phaeocystis globosa]QRN73082.1 preprotein translocase subunit SecY [Phaeocystis globosa]